MKQWVVWEIRGFSTVFEEGYIFPAFRSLPLPRQSCTIPAHSPGGACPRQEQKRLSPLSLPFQKEGFSLGGSVSTWTCLLGVESGQWTNGPKRKNCGESRLFYFPGRLCGSISGGLGVEGGLERGWRSHVEVRGKCG